MNCVAQNNVTWLGCMFRRDTITLKHFCPCNNSNLQLTSSLVSVCTVWRIVSKQPRQAFPQEMQQAFPRLRKTDRQYLRTRCFVATAASRNQPSTRNVEQNELGVHSAPVVCEPCSLHRHMRIQTSSIYLDGLGKNPKYKLDACMQDVACVRARVIAIIRTFAGCAARDSLACSIPRDAHALVYDMPWGEAEVESTHGHVECYT